MKPVELHPVRIGIIGCGRATTTLHLPALQCVSNAKVVALADSDPEALHRATSQIPVEKAASDYRVLLEDPTIEAIAICVPAKLHVEMGLAAVDAGKHLFIEKPLALTVEDCDQLIKRAVDVPLKIMLGFNTRWHRLVRQARLLFRQGAFGQLEVVRSVLTSYHGDLPDWRKRRNSGGGVLFEMAMHHFDLWRYLLNEEIEEINAHTRTGTWEDETATVTARLGSGALASATFAECSGQENALEIIGRAGSLKVSFYRFDGLEMATPSDIPGSFSSRIKGLIHFAKELPRAIPKLRQGGEWRQSYVEEWRHFVSSVRTGEPVACGLEDGRRALTIALAAMESAATGKTITVTK